MGSQMKYKVEISESLQQMVEVEASTREEAERVALKRYRSGEIVLSADGFVSVEVSCLQRDVAESPHDGSVQNVNSQTHG